MCVVSEKKMKNVILILLASLSLFSSSADAAGCLKGAAVGAVVGHVAGRHAVVGAVGGCIIGKHLAKKKQVNARHKK
jgi:outer membrane lipoprotein SlyB